MSRQTSSTERRSLFSHPLFVWTTVPVVAIIILAVVYFINNRPPNIIVPTPAMPSPNGYDDFVLAGDMIGKIKHYGPCSSPRPVSSWTVTELEAFEKANAPALAIARRGLTKPYLCPPDRTYNSFIFAPFARFRETARTFKSEAFYYDTIGDHRNSANSMLDCIEFGVTIPRGGSLIHGLVGIAVEAIGSTDFDKQINNLSSDDLSHVAVRLDSIQHKRWPYSEIIREEGRSQVASLCSMMKDPHYGPSQWLYWFQPQGTGNPDFSTVWCATRLAFANKTAMVNDIKNYYDRAAIQLAGCYNKSTRVQRPASTAAIILVLDFGTAKSAFARAETRITILQTQVALRRYFLAHKSYPKYLSTLAPSYLKSEPIDPFGLGKLLRYKQQKNGQDYILYSLGPNQIDDGGTLGKWSGYSTPGDMVAGHI